MITKDLVAPGSLNGTQPAFQLVFYSALICISHINLQVRDEFLLRRVSVATGFCCVEGDNFEGAMNARVTEARGEEIRPISEGNTFLLIPTNDAI